MGHLGASVSPSRDVDLTGGSYDVAGRRARQVSCALWQSRALDRCPKVVHGETAESSGEVFPARTDLL